ncbi:MAG: chloramphenicol phosphotransferase [Chloroflexi bacterium]|nr:chloramphenicol phosphotransferase [Chloroflexota bacterium]MCC6893627.1 chloramphenicol phosphotransferase [Anaerolineae bacterium]
MTHGKIILLNGASSSGKSSIVQALQTTLDEAYLEAGIDKFLFMLPHDYLMKPDLWHQVIGYEKADSGDLLPTVGWHGHQLMRGMYRSIAALASVGNNVVADHVLLDKSWLADCLDVFAGYDVLFVGIQCPKEVLEAREKGRGDRTLGQAAGQAGIIHQGCIYDYEVDTSKLSAAECANQIKARLLDCNFTAFDQMRARK